MSLAKWSSIFKECPESGEEELSMIIGVIGAGVMGSGVAQSAAQAGHQVILLDLHEEILEKSKKEIHRNIRFQSFFNKGKDAVPAEEVLARITFSTDYALL
jgi:3-hydroxybutyryl-CoA dehydrogenase